MVNDTEVGQKYATKIPSERNFSGVRSIQMSRGEYFPKLFTIGELFVQ